MSVFETRVKTSFGVSIATGLALESLFEPTEERYDPDRVIPEKVDLKKVKFFLINGYTLVRNIINSLEQRLDIEVIEKKHLTDLIKTVNEEIAIIKSLTISVKDLPFIIILPNYSKSYIKYNTGKEVELGYINQTLSLLKLTNKVFDSVNESFYKRMINDALPLSFNNRETLLLTHFTIDLINADKVTLLESHTGVIKTVINFYTKFANFGKNDLIRIPFCKYSLYVFGDHVLVKGLGLKAKREFLNIAEDNKWKYSTSEMSVYEKLKNTDVGIALKNFNRS